MVNTAPIYNTKNLTISYLLVLSLIALLNISAYILIRAAIDKQASDAPVINLAGRQRMLSQKLTKEVLLMVQSRPPETRERYRRMLKTTLANWSRVHNGLQYGDKELKLPGNNSPNIRNMFAEIEPYYQEIKNTVDRVLTLETNDLNRLPPDSPLLQDVVEASSLYLEWMDRTVFQYDKEAQVRIDLLNRYEVYILIAALSLLLLVGLFVFHPMVTRVAMTYEAFQKKHRQLEQEIAEREQVEEDIKRSNADLEQFAYIASHDLQEPLRIVASYVQLLSRRYKGKLDTNADEFIDYAVDGATRMQMLINDLLDYSRVGIHGSDFADTNCTAVLSQALANIKTPIEKSGAVITHDPLPTIMADDVQIVQVFQNLINNAIKFSDKDTPLIHVSAKQDGDKWTFSVRDNGIGIEPEFFERIFQIFQRLHSRTKYSGTGIGLAICKRIVERHGGDIWVESEPGEGTTFYFTIKTR
ncbi:MAG: ATP-binding protein [Thermodesulfobacteriota bacterium]